MLWVAVVLVLVALLLFTLYVDYCHNGRLLAKIPGPKRLPLIGNALQGACLNQETAFLFLRNLRKNHGPIYKATSFFIAVVNVSGPAYVEKLLSTTRFNEKRTPYNFFKPWLCEGLLVSNGEKWKHRRKLLTPAFHFSILKNFCVTFNEQTERFLARVEPETSKECTDLIPLITRTTLEVMCGTSLGTSVHKDMEPVTRSYFDALHVFGEIIQARMLKVWLHSDLIHKLTPMSWKENKLVHDLHGLTTKIIQERKMQWKENNNNKNEQKREKRMAMLDLLLECEKEGTIDMLGIREEVDTFLFEGHDTTAMALSFMIMRIANETEVQDKIYEEMVKIFGESDRMPTMEDLNEMKYLECCIKESLRLYPSVPAIARYISEEIVLGEYTVPKGTFTFVHVYDLHRCPDTYPDPERFIPERFLPENTVKRNPYAYIPFSAGPRNCIGQKFAMLELKTVVSGLFRRYRVEAVTRPEDVVFIVDIVLRSKHPLLVCFRSRKHEETN